MNYAGEQVHFELPVAAIVPAYLEETYWWAYVHPNAVSLFERQWLVNLILWGNFNWDSHRLGRVVILSARIDDNAGLETFLMREFFGV